MALCGAAALVLIGTLVLAGCSSKKAQGLGPEGQAGQLGENGLGKSSLEQNMSGGLGGAGGPLSDIHFGYNEYTIEPQDGEVLRSNAKWLNDHAQTRVQVEGHCDERGSEEYNIALGAKRAQSAKDYLVTLGVSGSRISTISYGKELPLCQEHDESCWSQNRRDHFAVSQ
ncbi:MAG TPA: peptidoglycan-associated lipoprotein Pal [Candidatus Binataceae bacterium]